MIAFIGTLGFTTAGIIGIESSVLSGNISTNSQIHNFTISQFLGNIKVES